MSDSRHTCSACPPISTDSAPTCAFRGIWSALTAGLAGFPDIEVTARFSLRRDGWYNVSLAGSTVSSQYFQDSDLPVGALGSANFIPAKVPAYTVLDLTADWQVSRNIRLLGGITNLTDRKYYNRVFQNGIEPAQRRKIYAGVALGV